MTFPSLLLLLSFCFLLCLAWLWHLDRSHHGLPHLAAKTAHPMVHRLLTPRTPLDCPVCTGRRAGPFGCRTGLRLPSDNHHHLAVPRWAARSDLARALLPQPLAPA